MDGVEFFILFRTLIRLHLIQSHCSRGQQYPKQSDRRLTGSRLLTGLSIDQSIWYSTVNTTRILDFPTLFLNWYKKRVRSVFRTWFGTEIYVRARGHCKRSCPAEVPEDSRVLRVRRLWFLTSDRLETWLIPSRRPGREHITSQPWSLHVRSLYHHKENLLVLEICSISKSRYTLRFKVRCLHPIRQAQDWVNLLPSVRPRWQHLLAHTTWTPCQESHDDFDQCTEKTGQTIQRTPKTIWSCCCLSILHDSLYFIAISLLSTFTNTILNMRTPSSVPFSGNTPRDVPNGWLLSVHTT